MKYTTLEEIINLKNIMAGRALRVENLTKMLRNGVKKSDRNWIEKELEEHEEWMKYANTLIQKFYAPAA